MCEKMLPKFTIITVTFNAAEHIERCLNSVLKQTYSDFEYIVIDGASKDTTCELVRQICDPRVKLISEPDEGIYDAMNKGLAQATGECVCILNADDMFANDGILQRLKDVFDDGQDIVIGDIAFFAKNQPTVFTRYWKVKPYVPGAFAEGWHAPHPGFFFRHQFYTDLGGFNTAYTISADFDLMMRYLLSTDQVRILNELTTLQQDGGTSTHLKNIWIGNEDIRKCLRANNVRIGFLRYYAIRMLPKILNKVSFKFRNFMLKMRNETLS